MNDSPSIPAGPAFPIRMLFAVALLALYSCVAGWIAISEHSWPYVPVAVCAAVACVGTAMLRRWSQYLVYLLNAAFLAGWGYSIYASYRAGLFRLTSGWQLARFITPDVVMVLLAGFCSYAVFSNFRRRG